jgi:predicted Zn-dependent protease
MCCRGAHKTQKKVYSDLLSKKVDDVTAPLGLADIAIAEKKWPEATSYVNRARAADPNDLQPGIKLVTLYELRQDWKNALAVAGELVAQFPREAAVHIAQATAELGTGDTKSAIATYGRARDLAPGSMPILSRYVSLLNSAKEFREARSVLEDAIARDPKNAFLKGDLIRVEAAVDGVDSALANARAFAKDDPNNNLYDLISAETYEKAARPKDAIALLEKAVATHQSDDALTIGLFRLYTEAGDLTKAEAVLNQRMAADEKRLTVPAILARLYVTTGRADGAKKIYTEILAERPSDVGAVLGLGVAEKEATDYMTRARTAAPSDPRPGLMLVNMYGLQQDWKKATLLAADLAARFPANVEVLDAQGRVQIGAGDMDGALSTYKRAYALAPNSGPLLSRYLALLKETKNFPDAKMVLQAALDGDPQNSALKGELIRVEAQVGGLEAGLAKANRFAENDPGNSIYDVVSAELYGNAGRGKEAVALLDKLAATRPLDDNLALTLFRLYSRTDDRAKAEAVLNARLENDPKDFAIRSVLAGFYLEQRKYDTAVDEYTRLIAERPADPTSLNNLAWLYQRRGNLAKARELAERTFAADPAGAQIEDTLGWILLAQGEADKAMTYLSAANSAAPASPDIQYHLAVALQHLGRSADAQEMLEKLLGSGVSFTDRAEAERLLQDLKHS